MSRHPEADLSRVRTYRAADRPSLVAADALARPVNAGASVADFLDSLPDLLKVRELRQLAEAVVVARKNGAPVVIAAGAHVIKAGLSPLIVDLMDRGLCTAVALNGAGIIHDFEVALVGATSEDVDETLGPGRFGMADETGRLLNQIIAEAAKDNLGFGQAVGRYLAQAAQADAPHRNRSLAASAHDLGVPVTVHVAIGTDITHMHPKASGAAIGDVSLRDFRYFTSCVARLRRGVYMNCGSAVVLPEVFLKAVALARNRGVSLDGLTTINLDFARLYRPHTNVVSRPTAGIGRGFSLIGHHELMIPLLAAALIERSSEAGPQTSERAGTTPAR